MSVQTLELGRGMTGQQMVPVAGESEWLAICTDPKNDDKQYALRPLAIERAAQGVANVNRSGTTIEACLRYDPSVAVSTPPAIQLIGISRAGVPQLLADEEGNTTFTLTAAATDLVDAAGRAYTAAVQVDAKNNAKVMALVTTALVGGGVVGAEGTAIMVKAL